MKFLLYILLIVLFMPFQSYALDCPKIPEQTNKEWDVEVKATVGKIGPVKGGELESRTKKAVRDLMGKLPQADKVYIEQMMYSAYCSALRDDKTIKESEKAKLLLEYNREVRKAITRSPAAVRKSTIPPKNEDGSKSVDELISLLESRFESIMAEIDAKKKELDELGRFKGINDADERQKSLRKLHEQIKTSLKKREFVKAHELIDDFQDKLESFYVYPLTLTQKHRYIHAPEPGQDRDYDALIRAIVQVRGSTKKKYPGPEIDSFLAAKAK